MDCSYLSLEGQVALITGASRGIGKAIAMSLADAGADVAIASRTLADLEAVASEIRATCGRRAFPVATHVRKSEDLKNLVDAVMAEYGKIDILVNNASTNPGMGLLTDMDERMYDQIMNTNLKGYTTLSQLVGKSMQERGSGCILNIASVGGIHPSEGLGLYSISKAGILMLTKVMARELGPFGVRVNCIAPGYVQTRFSEGLWSNEDRMKERMPKIPLRRISQPEEVGRVALFLLSNASAYITGQTLVMDGGQTI